MSKQIPCNTFDALVEELDLHPTYQPRPGTGWHIVEWGNESLETVLQSHTYYDRDFPTECVHYDKR